MPKGEKLNVHKNMTCKKCGAVVRGRPLDMAAHVRNSCPGLPPKRRGSDFPEVPPTALDEMVEFVDNLDAAAISAEIQRLDKRRASLDALLKAAQARHQLDG